MEVMQEVQLFDQAATVLSFTKQFVKDNTQMDVFSSILLHTAEDDIDQHPQLERFEFLADIHDELDQLMTGIMGKITYFEGQECQVDFMTDGDYPTNTACHRVSASWENGDLILVWTIKLVQTAYC